METRTNSSWLFLCVLMFFSSNIHLSFAANDTLSSGQSLSGDQTLVSKEGNFELGFFSPGSSANYYIGIWYKKISIANKTVVWVANRDIPLTDIYSSEFKLLEDGNLVVLNLKLFESIWSTGLTPSSTSSSEVVLGDDGNLVLRDGSNPSNVFWQSFDHPTDTFLPGGKLSYNNLTKLATLLTSWKSLEDPGKGMFSLQLDPNTTQYVVIWKRSTKYWTSGSWDGQRFSLVPEMRLNYIYNYSYISNKNESYFTYSVYNTSIISRCVLGLSGQVRQYTWLDNSQTWNLFWSQPRKQCEVYGFCGAFSICDERGLPFCQCLPDFEPRSLKDWNQSGFSGGCIRRSSSQCGDQDGFLLMFNIKWSENKTSLPINSTEECRVACLSDCSCNAYSYYHWCFMWNKDLLNLQQLSEDDTGGREIYVRSLLAEIKSYEGGKPTEKTYIIVLVSIGGSIFLGVVACILLMLKIKGRWLKKKIVEIFGSGKYIETPQDSPEANPLGDRAKDSDSAELKSFSFETITMVTKSFTDKLGEGGYGPVYKGKLEDGRHVASKRLSRSSGQGIQEFKNELKLISKLQHRNLVKLFGYCVEREEKILLYEYMPNKSLDSFLFDPKGKEILDWGKRFNIIDGIARGLLYLHRDSRLRVIHRDLKASNILLDEDMNPKISDFGMARIFNGDQTLANTNRVVGTYGYMSPEYAMAGMFSEKSDVFSFGVLLLEIVSSKRNTSFYHHEKFVNLLAYAWELWNEGKPLQLMDPTLAHSYSPLQVMRCIQVGLLCVEEHPVDRPTMSTVVSMLVSETNLPTPKQPAFTLEIKVIPCGVASINSVTITSMYGR